MKLPVRTVILSNCVMVVFLLIFFLITGCQTSQLKGKDETVIKGNIQFPPGKIIYFMSFSDTINLYLEQKTVVDSSTIDEDGNYFMMPHIKAPCAFNIECDGIVLIPNLFLCPGDFLEINFIGRKNRPVILKSGQEARNNNFLLQFLDSFYKDPELKPQYYIATNYMDVNQFKTYTVRRKNQQLTFFNNFFKGDSIRPAFREYALNTIEYGIAVDRFLYLWKKRMKNELVHPDSDFFDFETETFIENKKAFACPAYVHFLNFYIKDTYERMIERGELPVVKNEPMIPPVEKYKLALRLLHPPYRDAVLYNLIMNDLNDVTSVKKVDAHSFNSLDELEEMFKKKYSIE